MQKKIIALAIAATLSAPAFADVTPYGIIDGAIASISATGQKSDLLAVSGGASTSRIGAKATEDLGNGLTAVGVLEYALDTEVATGLSTATARQQMVAVAGSFGTVATGYLQTAGYDWEAKFDPLAGSSVSNLQVVNAANFLIGTAAVAKRAQRAIAYISPDIHGLTVAVNYSTALAGLGDLTVADSAAAAKTSAYLVSGTYTRDAFALGLVYAATTAPTSAASQTEYALGGSYDLGVAKVLATYQSNTTNSVTNSAYSASVVVPVGADAFAAQYATNSMNAANSNGSGFTLGYLKTLSKTTTAYAAYQSVSNGSGTHSYSVDGNAVASSAAAGWTANGGSSSLIAVGLRKKF